MATCAICYDEFKRPVSLPCGHIFCTECIVNTIQAITPPRTLHTCPTCRVCYSIAPINAAAIPAHLRPFVTSSIRRVYLDAPIKEEAPSSSSTAPTDELARLRAENQTLRNHCLLWRRRAELHGAATLGLLDFSRMVRDQAVTLAQERDELKKECRSLKRKLDESVEQTPTTSQLPYFKISPAPSACPQLRNVLDNAPTISRRADKSRVTVSDLLDMSCASQSGTSQPSLDQFLSRPTLLDGSSTSTMPPTLTHRSISIPDRPVKRMRQADYDLPTSQMRSINASGTLNSF
ncbi:hypothetical protein FA15DRAFT_672237 [Coprinopsis marcescibilis]|uniref:RING-type domain-containing protein n=1 Tax=Coprinopsis marcescibilis TaxID=230819 RepID=A0A5C3KN76_COPMA|nr:hypothetical protein FA15DRAFT_672237 [Coprinopsis marcescibilis]